MSLSSRCRRRQGFTLGVHRAMLDSVRRRALDGQPNPSLAHDVRFQAERALRLLEKGLSDYRENDHQPKPANR